MLLHWLTMSQVRNSYREVYEELVSRATTILGLLRERLTSDTSKDMTESSISTFNMELDEIKDLLTNLTKLWRVQHFLFSRSYITALVGHSRRLESLLETVIDKHRVEPARDN